MISFQNTLLEEIKNVQGVAGSTDALTVPITGIGSIGLPDIMPTIALLFVLGAILYLQTTGRQTDTTITRSI